VPDTSRELRRNVGYDGAMRCLATAAVLSLCTVGCGQSSESGPHLQYIDTGLDQRVCPLVFALKLTNEGDAPVVVDNVRFQITSRTLLYDNAGDEFPNEFNCELALVDDDHPAAPFLLPSDSISIAPGEVRDVRGVIRWIVPADAPPMLAIICAELIPIRDGAEIIRTEPVIMFLQSGPGALDAVRLSTTTNREQAAQVVAGLRAIEGKRSFEFEDLIRSIDLIANPGWE
jgi:hypothetical protein